MGANSQPVDVENSRVSGIADKLDCSVREKLQKLYEYILPISDKAWIAAQIGKLSKLGQSPQRTAVKTDAHKKIPFCYLIR